MTPSPSLELAIPFTSPQTEIPIPARKSNESPVCWEPSEYEDRGKKQTLFVLFIPCIKSPFEQYQYIYIYLYSIVANHYITMYTYVYFAGPHWNFVSPTMFVSFSKSNLVFRCIELPAKTSLSHFLHCSLDFRRHSGQLPRGGQRRGSRPNCAG